MKRRVGDAVVHEDIAGVVEDIIPPQKHNADKLPARYLVNGVWVWADDKSLVSA